MARERDGVFESKNISVDWAGELVWSEKSHGKPYSHEYMVLLFPQQNKNHIIEFYGWCADVFHDILIT